MQKFNYHTHSFRCGHIEEGYTDEEIILDHIAAGFEQMAFTEHRPEQEPVDDRPGARMANAARPEYLATVAKFKEKYADKIKILSGYEIEYWPGQEQNLRELKAESDILVLGQHYVKGDDGNLKIVRKNALSSGEVQCFADLVTRAMELGLPDIVAHPDLYLGWQEGFGEAEAKAAHQICKMAEKTGIPLEINLNNICCYTFRKDKVVTATPIAEQAERMKKVRYPRRAFWEIAAQYDIKVLYGVDVHYRNEVAVHDGLRQIADLIIGEDIIDKLHFVTEPLR